MDDLAALLRQRIAESLDRIASHRAAIASEEEALKRWKDVLALELDMQSPVYRVKPMSELLTLADARNNEAIVRKFLGQAKDGLNSSELTKLIHPAVSRSGMFALLKRMKDAGTVVQDKNGNYFLADKEKGDSEEAP